MSLLSQFTKHQTKPQFEWIKKSTHSAQMQWFTKTNISWLPTPPSASFWCTQTRVSPPSFPIPSLHHSQQNPTQTVAPWHLSSSLGNVSCLCKLSCHPEKGAPAPQAACFSKQCSILGSVRQIFAVPVPLSTGLAPPLIYFSLPMNFLRGNASSPLYLKGVGFLSLQFQVSKTCKPCWFLRVLTEFFSSPQAWCFAHLRLCSLSTPVHALRHCL